MGAGDDVEWLGRDEQLAWRAYILGTELLQHQLDHELREEHDISFSEYEILVRLSEAVDGRMRMATLADSMCHSRSRVTHTIARMENAGLVVRQASRSDGRGVEAVMTKAGNERLVEAAPTHVRGVRAHMLDLASTGGLPGARAHLRRGQRPAADRQAHRVGHPRRDRLKPPVVTGAGAASAPALDCRSRKSRAPPGTSPG